MAAENYSLPFPIFNAGLTAPVADVLDFSRAKLIDERLDRRSLPEFVRLRNKVKPGSTPGSNHRRRADHFSAVLNTWTLAAKTATVAVFETTHRPASGGNSRELQAEPPDARTTNQRPVMDTIRTQKRAGREIAR